MAWATVYEVDWRDAFASLGAVDLNSVGSSFTYEGITWKTPSVARGNPFDMKLSTSWGLVSTGLRAVSPDNSRFVATNTNAPHVYATLPEIAANSATPFAADPTRMYLFQGYASSFTDIAAGNDSGIGVGFYKIDEGTTAGNAVVLASFLGRDRSGDSPVNYGIGGVGALPAQASREDLSINVLTAHYKSGMRQMVWAGSWTGDWPANADLEFIGASKDSTAVEHDIVQDPTTFRVAAAINNAPNFIGNSYDGTFQRFRVLQWE